MLIPLKNSTKFYIIFTTAQNKDSKRSKLSKMFRLAAIISYLVHEHDILYELHVGVLRIPIDMSI